MSKSTDGKDWEIPASIASEGTINKIRQIVDQLDMSKIPKNKEFISVSIGDPTKFPNLRPNPTIITAVEKVLKSLSWNGYAPSFGHDEARTVLAKKYSYPHIKVDKSDVFLGSGCSDALNMSFVALLNPGDNVLLPRPGFSFYETLCGRYGFEDRYYNCLPEKNWAIDVKQLETLIDKKTKAILINNPSNPCGSVLTRKNLEDVLRVARKHRVAIVADEIYDGMVFGDEPFVSLASISRDVPIFTCGGMAKKFLVPGWRLGWVIVHDPVGAAQQIKEALVKLSTVLLGPNTLIQAALPMILEETPQTFYRELNETLRSQSSLFYQLFKKIPELKPIKVDGAMYMMVGIDIKKLKDIRDDIEFANALLREEGVLILPGSIFGMPNYFRVVTCPPPNIIQEVGNRLNEFCARHSNREKVSAKL